MKANTQVIGKIRPYRVALKGDGVPLTNALAGLITLATLASMAVGLRFYSRVMPGRCLSNEFPQHTV
jgi:hypothetical protein